MYRNFVVIVAATGMLLLSVCMHDVRAQETDLGFKGGGFRIGMVDPEGSWKPTSEFGLTADLGSPMENVFLDGSIGYWASKLDDGLPAGYEFTLSDFSLRVGGKYQLMVGATSPFVGGGVGYHLYALALDTPSGESSSELLNDYTQDDQGVLYLTGGVEQSFGENVLGSVAARFDIAELTQMAFQVNFNYMIGR